MVEGATGLREACCRTSEGRLSAAFRYKQALQPERSSDHTSQHHRGASLNKSSGQHVNFIAVLKESSAGDSHSLFSL